MAFIKVNPKGLSITFDNSIRVAVMVGEECRCTFDRNDKKAATTVEVALDGFGEELVKEYVEYSGQSNQYQDVDTLHFRSPEQVVDILNWAAKHKRC
jgi:hypothetical protein